AGEAVPGQVPVAAGEGVERVAVVLVELDDVPVHLRRRMDRGSDVDLAVADRGHRFGDVDRTGLQVPVLDVEATHLRPQLAQRRGDVDAPGGDPVDVGEDPDAVEL